MKIKSLITNKKDKRSLLLIILLLIMISVSGSVFAKYIIEIGNENLFIAKNFYFESDLLSKEIDAPPTYKLKSNENEITFALMNYPDDLRTSQVDIDCKIVLTKDNNDIDQKQIALSANTKDEKIVTFSGLTPGEYTVTATTLSPYAAVLSANFELSKEETFSYSISDQAGSPNLLLTVTSTGYEGDITITWPDGVYPDITDPLLKNATGKAAVVKMKPHSEYTLQFFKNNPTKEYTDNIKVTTE